MKKFHAEKFSRSKYIRTFLKLKYNFSILFDLWSKSQVFI